MVVTNARMLNDSIDADKLTDGAVKNITLRAGETLVVRNNSGFPLFTVDNDTRKVSVRGNVDKIR